MSFMLGYFIGDCLVVSLVVPVLVWWCGCVLLAIISAHFNLLTSGKYRVAAMGSHRHFAHV